MNVASPVSVASQCKLVLTAIETERRPKLCGSRRTLFLYICLNIEHQNRHKSFLLHCVLHCIVLNRHILSRLIAAMQILARNGNCLSWP